MNNRIKLIAQYQDFQQVRREAYNEARKDFSFLKSFYNLNAYDDQGQVLTTLELSTDPTKKEMLAGCQQLLNDEPSIKLIALSTRYYGATSMVRLTGELEPSASRELTLWRAA